MNGEVIGSEPHPITVSIRENTGTAKVIAGRVLTEFDEFYAIAPVFVQGWIGRAPDDATEKNSVALEHSGHVRCPQGTA